MEEFVLEAEVRSEFGSRSTKRLRSRGKLPAVLYGHKEENAHLTLDTKEFTRFLEAGHRVLSVKVDGVSEKSLVKDVQYDAFGSNIIHVDFARISADEQIQMEVSIDLIGVAKGVSSGGVMDFPRKEVLVRGLPDKVPESVQVNIEPLDLGAIFRIGDLPPVPECEYVEDPELVVLSISEPHAEAEPTEGEEPSPTEPEVIRKKAADDEADGSS